MTGGGYLVWVGVLRVTGMEPKGNEMQNAYRYAPQKYNDSLLGLGNIRIGTLHDYRNTEHVKGVSDAHEGKKTVKHKLTIATDKDKDSKQWKAVEAFGFFSFEGSKNITIRGGTFIREYNEPNCYIHCTSIDYSSTVLDQFAGADSCVEIVDLFSFYMRLTETLSSIEPIDFQGVYKVKYTKRDQIWNGVDWGEHPALIKDPDFKKQVELRAIWAPRHSGSIRPIVVNDVGLINFVRRKDTPVK